MDITVNNIWKTYGDQTVLEDFSCVFPEKRLTCIMGESGCGKTTLINILLGLQRPDKGQIQGISKESLSAVFQEDRLCENLSAVKNLRLVCKKKITDENLRQIFHSVKLEDFEQLKKQPVCELSGGMRRRVAILRALITDARCVVMDEPLKGLDEETKKQTIQYIKAAAKDRTVIVVTHEEKEAQLLEAVNIIRMS